MASTNKTTNYELSQFVGSDKPAWLGDYNTDMGKIDTQMKANADSATSAGGKADANTAKIGTLSSLTTETKTDLVSAINEVDTNADSATTTATQANATAGSALSASSTNATAIQAIQSYLNLSVNNSYSGSQISVVSGSGTPQTTDNIYVARNADGTLGKIYGTFLVNNATTTAGRTRFKLNLDTGLRPTEAIDIVGTGLFMGVGNNTVANANIRINTDGTLEFEGYHDSNQFYVRLFACLLFIQNFGDQPE